MGVSLSVSRALILSVLWLLSVLYLTACDQILPVEIYTEPDIPHAQLGDNIAPTRYQLELKIDPKQDRFSGLVHIDIDIKQPVQSFWIHAKHINPLELFVTQDESVIAASFSTVSLDDAPSGLAKVETDTPLMSGPARLTFAYDAPFNRSLSAAYKVERDGLSYILTQFEALGAREAFPSFDEPRFKVPFDMSITAPDDEIVYANTPQIGSVADGIGWTKHFFATTRPLPTYLIAFGVGPYDVVEHDDIPPNDIRERALVLRGFAAKGSGDQMGYGLENTADILEVMEEYFGSEYPYEKLDIIAAPEFAYGAMENPGAILYREILMLLSDDAPRAQKRAYASVHAHELAHQWFGNLVTPVWWEDIWLNEAFATWMGNKAIALWRPDGDFDRNTLSAALAAMSTDSLASTRSVREPLLRSENVHDQFDSITYRKGGGVLSMFESYLGEDKFRDGVRLHMDRYADGVATGDDFFTSIAEGSGNPDVVSAMKSFVDQPGLPMVTASIFCSDDVCAAPSLNFTQSRYAPLGSHAAQGQVWEIPICVTLGYGDETEKLCSLLKTDAGSESLAASGRPDWIMPNADGAGYYRFSLKAADWQALLDNIGGLNAREALAALDSLTAAFEAGQVDSATYIAGMERFAAYDIYDVAMAAGGKLGWMAAHLPESARGDISRLTNDMYARRYVRAVGAQTSEGELLAPVLATRLIKYGGNPVLRAEYAQKARRYLGVNGPADKTALSSAFLNQAFIAFMLDDPKAAMPALLEQYTSGTALGKRAALAGLAEVPSRELAVPLLETALSDVDITGRQANDIVRSLLQNHVTADLAWQWLQDNFEAFITTRVPDQRKTEVPSYVQGCSAETYEATERFFTDNGALIPGYELSLRQGLEQIALCTAFKNHAQEGLAAALSAR